MFTVNNFDLLEVLAYIFLWATIYFILCLWNSSRSFEWHCRIVTTVHALVISFLAFYCTFRVGPSPFTDAGKVAVLMEVIIFLYCMWNSVTERWSSSIRTFLFTKTMFHYISIMWLVSCEAALKSPPYKYSTDCRALTCHGRQKLLSQTKTTNP